MPKYSGLSFPTDHVMKCIVVEIGTKTRMDSLICAYSGHNSQELVHRTRSAQRDKRLGRLTRNFKVTFSFESNNPLIDSTLQVLRNNIFASKDLLGSMPLYSAPRVTVTVEEVLHCYNVAEESKMRKIQGICRYQRLKGSTQ
jgi:hypothetical protein